MQWKCINGWWFWKHIAADGTGWPKERDHRDPSHIPSTGLSRGAADRPSSPAPGSWRTASPSGRPYAGYGSGYHIATGCTSECSATVERLCTWACPTGPRRLGSGARMLRRKQPDPVREGILFDFEAGEVTDARSGASSGDIPQSDGRVVSWTVPQGIDTVWLLKEMEIQVKQALEAIHVLQDRVED